MMVFLEWALIAANLLAMPHLLFLAAVALAAMRSRRRTDPPGDGPRSRFLIVIPAHDEESGIAATVASCRRVDYPEGLSDVLVIADNCSDRTAEVAAAAGARVVARSDAEKKSKGYAIEYLIGRLIESGEFDALDAIVVIDADTTIDPDLLLRFDEDLRAGRDWIQCYYTVADPDRSWRTRLMTYAFSLFNGVLPMGQSRLGSSAGLRGNGMVFSTRGLRRRPWRSYGLVEDMEFSWMLRLDGETIAFEPAARVHGAMLSSGGRAAANQRRRWEFGRGEVRRRFIGPVLRSRRIGPREKLISLLELTLPTMGLLLSGYLLLTALDLLAILAAPAPGAPSPWIFSSLIAFMTVSVGLYAVSPFLALRLPWKYAMTLAMVPSYIAWKALVRLRGRPGSWIRTDRESRPDAVPAEGPGPVSSA